MPSTFNLPDPGEGIHEAEIVELNVSTNDEVEESQVLMAVETDKALVEIPSPFTGRVTDVLVEEGQRVEVGAPLLEYEEAGAKTEEGRAAAADVRGSRSHAPGQASESASGARAGDLPVPAAPATRRLARELDVDLRAVTGSGPAGRVTADDVRRAADGRGRTAEAEHFTEPAERREAAPADGGEGERWEVGEGTERDVEQPSGVPRKDGDRGQVTWEPLRSVRRTTAERLSASWARTPHVTHFDHADITELDRLRERHADAVKAAGGSLTLTVFVLKATVAVLKEFPRFNAYFDEGRAQIGLLHYFDLGLAVDTDRGLVVPVVRDVDASNLTDLAVEVRRLAGRARAGELTTEEMRGGTFTLTNPGPIGGEAFTPIINPPQVAILGTARAAWEPVVQGEGKDRAVVPRYRLPLCLAFDHRVNDGAGAARFMNRLVQILEDTDSFIRHL